MNCKEPYRWADRDGNTALHVAVLANNICCVRTLLNR
jgi:ankyrin repeat protein